MVLVLISDAAPQPQHCGEVRGVVDGHKVKVEPILDGLCFSHLLEEEAWPRCGHWLNQHSRVVGYIIDTQLTKPCQFGLVLRRDRVTVEHRSPEACDRGGSPTVDHHVTKFSHSTSLPASRRSVNVYAVQWQPRHRGLRRSVTSGP